jgi:hypothetical protein
LHDEINILRWTKWDSILEPFDLGNGEAKDLSLQSKWLSSYNSDIIEWLDKHWSTRFRLDSNCANHGGFSRRVGNDNLVGTAVGWFDIVNNQADVAIRGDVNLDADYKKEKLVNFNFILEFRLCLLVTWHELVVVQHPSD